jgi:hypothetical protein
MMRFTLIVATGIVALLTACGGDPKDQKDGKPTQKMLMEEVKLFEDSIKKRLVPEGSKTMMHYSDKCLAVYRNYPKSKEAPAYLDKAHIILSGGGYHNMAVLYADTLIRKYPAYDNRAMVLQSLATAYDLFIIPRKKELVIKYYTLLLKENPKMPKEERENIEFRLKHIDMSFDQLIEMQANKDNS